MLCRKTVFRPDQHPRHHRRRRRNLSTAMSPPPQGFYQLELNKTVWEVPERYQNLTPVGSGAYGQVSTEQVDLAMTCAGGLHVIVHRRVRPLSEKMPCTARLCILLWNIKPRSGITAGPSWSYRHVCNVVINFS